MTTVLVIDDNAMNRKLARDVLEAAGFRTVEAATAAEGIAQAAEHEPDVILLDLRLPDMPGVEVARRLRGEDAGAPDPDRGDERAVARGARRVARGGRFRRLHRQADPGEHVPGSGATLLHGALRVARPRDTLLAPP